MNLSSLRWRALAAATAALFAAACAQSNGDINRVQPNVVKKADLLDGVWFFRNTVTWTPATTGFTYPGQTGLLEKLVFEIQEKTLVGYRAYPFILGAEINIDQTSKVTGTTVKYCDKDGKCVGGQKYYGNPIVAFPIATQFDIQRAYDPATGELGNVIAENATDRPWNQREFIRVDWSANLLNVNGGLGWGTIQNASGGSSSQSWIQPNEKGEDPTDWPSREYDKDGKLVYMDYTGRFVANPDVTYFEGYGYAPLCWFRGYGQYDCSSSEIRQRISMSKVDPQKSRDYEPLQYSNEVMTKFGYFRTERLNYDRKFGFNESARILLAQRHRIWKSSFEVDAKGEPDSTKPIAMSKRELKPIAYYMSRADLMGGTENYDQYMVPAKKLEANWDKAFRRAVVAARGEDRGEQVLFVCDNPVKVASDACGAVGFSPKFGDLRYSFINTVAEPVANGLLGYGPSSADPETGEIVSATANTYLWGIDLYGRQLLDYIDLLVGDKTITDYITGDDMKEYIKNNPSYSAAIVAKNSTNCAGGPGQSCLIQSELQGISTRNEQTLGAFQHPTARSAQLLQGLKASGGLPPYSQDASRAAADVLAQSPQLESAILDNPDLGDDVIGLLPSELQERATNDKDFRRKASRGVLTNIKASRDYQQARIEWASRNNVTLAEFFDRTMLGLANREAQKRADRMAELIATPPEGFDAKVAAQLASPPPYFAARVDALVADSTKGCTGILTCTLPACSATSACQSKIFCATAAACMPAVAANIVARQIANDEVSMRIRQAVWESTSEHEIGHTFGLRHNFQGSFDAINYFDPYWEIRKPTLTVQQNGENKIPRTPADLKAAADGTLPQLAAGMHDYEYSSIMDYAGKINGDWGGPGKYDEAAILFAYSGDTQPGYVEVFDGARRNKMDFPGSDGAIMTITGAGLDLPIVNAQHKSPGVKNYTERYHYSVAPLHFGEGANIDQVMADGIKKFHLRSLKKYSEVKLAQDKLAAALELNPALANDPDAAAGTIGTTPLEVPYMFCSDDHVGGVLSCNRFDRGPDYYEMARTHLEDYYNYYFSSHFKRDRLNFSSNGAFNGAFNTFMDTADIYKKWVFEFYKKAATGQELVTQAQVDPMMQDYWTMAVLDGINEHLNVMSVPPAGMFMFRNLPQGPQWDIVSEGDDYDALNPTGRAVIADYYRTNYNATDFADLPRGLGRRMYSRYDYKSGFGFWNRMQEAGHYNDQMGAMFAAVIPDAQFQGVDENADFRRYNIPYYLVFKPELTDTFSALWGNNEQLVRPTMYFAKDEAGNVTTRATLAWKRFVNGADLITGFQYPKATGVNCTGSNTVDCLTADQKPGQANIQLTWTSRMYSLYLGEALFRVNYDLDYAKANQIFKLGGGESQTVAPGFHTVEVQDITTGSRYLAMEKDGAAVDSTPAIRMLNISKEELQMVKDPTTCPLPPYLAYVGYSGSAGGFGGSCMRAADANNPSLVQDRRNYWIDVFRNNVRDLDLMRGMYSAYGKAF